MPRGVDQPDVRVRLRGVADLPPRRPDVLDLITLRSNDQFNTTVYGYDDRFRGVKGTRDVLFMNRRDIARLLDIESDRIGHLSARLSTLGPAATLARGYAVVQAVPASGAPHVLQSAADAPAGTRLRVRVADGAVTAISEGEGGAEDLL